MKLSPPSNFKIFSMFPPSKKKSKKKNHKKTHVHYHSFPIPFSHKALEITNLFPVPMFLFAYSEHLLYTEPYNMWPSIPDFLQLAQCF